MTSIIRQIEIDAAPEKAWAALRDFGALREMAPEFVADVELEDERTRVVTFHSGAKVHEVLIGIDDAERRIAWTITDLPGAAFHSGAATVVPDDAGAGRCQFVWHTDVLPDEVADRLAPMMEQGLMAIKRRLESLERLYRLNGKALYKVTRHDHSRLAVRHRSVRLLLE